MSMYNSNLVGNLIDIDNEHYFGNLSLETITLNTKMNDTPFVVNYNNSSIVIHNNLLHILNGSDIYKFENGVWTLVATLPYTKTYNTAMTSYNGNIYTFGIGESNTGDKNYMWNGTTWTKIASVNSSYTGFCNIPAFTYKNYIYLIGSCHSLTGSVYRNCYRFDGTSFSSAGTAPIDPERSYGAVCNGYIYIFFTDNNSLYRYNGSSWSQINMPISYYFPYMASYKNKLHLFGGVNAQGFNMNKHHIYDGNTWEESDEEPPYPGYGGLAIGSEKKIYFLGSAFIVYTSSSSSSSVAPYNKKFYTICEKAYKTK